MEATQIDQLASNPQLIPAFLQDRWPALSHYEKVELIRGLAASSSPGRQAVLEALFAHLDSPVFQAQLLSVLDVSKTQEPVPRFVLEALEHPNSRVRANAIECLGTRFEPTLTRTVRERLGDEDNRVRANACVYLWADAAERPLVTRTIEEMAEASDPWVRASAVFAASRLNDASCIPILEKALDDDYEPAVVLAVRALVRQRHAQILPRIVQFLSDAQRGSTSLWHEAVDAVLALEGKGDAVEDGLLAVLGATGDPELLDKVFRALERQEGSRVAARVLDFLEKMQPQQLHLCQRLLELVGKRGEPEHRNRLQALASGKLAMWSDVVMRTVRELGKRRRWWSR